MKERKDGQPHYYQITKSAAHDESDNIIGIVGVVMDVTVTKVQFSEENRSDYNKNIIGGLI